MSYPWLTDSKKGTTPLITDYLEVASPNGLYLNSTNSQVLLKNPATNEKLTLSKSAIDFYSTNGTSCVLIDNTHIHLNELVPTTTPFTTDITNSNIILQSNNYITPYLQTLTIQPNMVQHLNPDFSMIMGTGSYQTQALGVPRISTLNPYVCSLGFDGGSYQGDLNCRNIVCSLINGYAPTTTGLIWSDFNNAYPNLLNGRYYLTDTTYETYQDTQQFYARNMSGNISASYTWSGINTSGGTFTLYTSGQNFDLNCATFNINGIPYSPGGGGGGVTDIQAGSGISVNQNTGSVTITNTGGGGVTDIQAGPGIYVNQTTGSVTITNTGGGGGSQDLATTLSYGNYANTSINMNGNSIDNVSTINGYSFPQSISIPQTAYAMPFQSGYTTNFNQTIFTSGVTITGGYSYSVVWTFWYDSLSYSGSPPEMIQGYADLYNSSTGNIKGSANQSGYWASATISSNNMYRTTITYTDNYSISFTDTYYPIVLQSNTINWDGTTYLSAVITRTSL
jgi:hypothetical protein